MAPTLGTFWGITVNTHDVFAGAALFVATVVFCYEKRRRGMADDRLWVVAALALAWAQSLPA